MIDKFKVQTEEERQIASDTIEFFWRLVTFRVNFHQQWKEISALIWPECLDTFDVGSYNYPGQKYTQNQLDSTGMQALDRFTGIMQHLLTPADTLWHQLRTTDPYLNKQPAVAAYFEKLTNILFAHRYAQTANFQGQCAACYKNLGAYGTHALFIDELDDPIGKRRGLRYMAIPMGELFLHTIHQGQVIGVIRYFRMTAMQCLKQFGEDAFPPGLVGASGKSRSVPIRVYPPRRHPRRFQVRFAWSTAHALAV